MQRNPVKISAVTFSAVALFSAGALFVQSLAPLRSDPADGTPQQLFSVKCSACHNLPDPKAMAMTAFQWKATVQRMLYRHGAKDSISPDQAQTITDYLTTFAVKPAAPGSRTYRDSSDEWATDPVYSHVYRFRSADIAAPFRMLAGKWTVHDTDNGPQLDCAALPGHAEPAVFVAPTPGPHGDLQVEAEFHAAVPASSSAPASFGLVFDAHDATDYDVAAYDDAKKQLTVTQFANGQSTVVQTVAVSSGLTATPDGWHKLKMNVIGTRVKVWLDFDKKIDTTLPEQPGNGGAGMWTAGKAAVRSFTLDIYPTDTMTNVSA